MPTPASDLHARAELVARLRDRNWRLRHLYKIKDDEGRVVPFRMRPVQEKLDAGLHYRNVVLKSRQHGITTYACIRALDMALFRSNTAVGIVADTKENALRFFREKIIFAYELLPEWLKAERRIVRQDMNGQIVFSNGSKIDVGTSLRSGTYQYVHISELGPMGAKYPTRAKETVSGTLNAVPVDGIVTIESTAEGAFGAFYDICQRALKTERLVKAGTSPLSTMDYKFFFLAWFEDPTNVLHEDVYISPALQEYFAKVEADTGTKLSPAQRAFYAKKAEEQGDSMWSEFPSTPEEAFKASTEGSYYGRLLTKAELEGRVCHLPFVPGVPVNTFWDIGRSDTTAIWFHQQVGAWHHFIDYLEHSGEGASYYATELMRLARERGYVYGKHFLPHDAEVKDWSIGENKSRAKILEDLGVKPYIIVPRILNLSDGIDMVRQAIPKCRFDKDRCGEDPPGSGRGGLPSLRAYRKEWNEANQCWATTPVHDFASNGADAFRQFAQGYRSVAEQPTTDPNYRQQAAKRDRRSPSTVARWRIS